jgi:hypothetical protein
MPIEIGRSSRFRGCLLGLAAGDAVGATVVAFEMEGPGRPLARDFFNHEALCLRYREVRITPELAEGQHFWDMPATSFDKTSYVCYI